MTSEDAVRAVVDALGELGIPHMLVGSFSSNAYGIPRSTRDLDLVIDLGTQTITTLAERLGPSFHLNPQLAFESITWTSRYVFEVPEIPFTIELFLLSGDSHDQERFRRRRMAKLLSRDMYLPPAEDVIITKLRWALTGRRAKDLDDVRGVLAVQAQQLDWAYLEHWCDIHGTRALLEEARRAIPPT